MKHLLQKLIVVSMIGAACVQVEVARAQYNLSHRTETYLELEHGVNIPMRWDDTVNPYTYVDLNGLTFKLFGEDFRLDATYPIAISKWGNVEIRSETSAVIIDAFHTSSLDSLTPGAQASLEVAGMNGDRILKIQWKDFGFTGFPTELVTNFQLWMYERTGNVEFHYGPHTLECDKTDPTLQGAYVGMFLALPDFSKFTKIYWLYGEPENPRISKVSIKAMHCAFDPNSAVTLTAPTAEVATQADMTPGRGLVAQRAGSIRLEHATSIKLYSVMGQLIRNAERVDASLSLDGIGAGPYFLEYQQKGETIRRALMIE